VEHVVWMGQMRNAYNILVGQSEGRDHLEDLCTDARIISEWILEKQNRKLWTGFICQHRDE